ncbi:hypothetical protein [Acidimangrovimonas pyrenivorans]|uniref:UspA domain-containing protein n=1 Tax=Acidimangrovimonas pyrenivorans TaxID=2030798 RepID=A0ABV7AJ34_9RHOB
MTRAPRQRQRILIGAGSFADAESALQLAERIAGPLASDLGGVMIEDRRLAELLGQPGYRIVTAAGTLAPAPSRPELQRLVAAQARAFEAGLARLAAARALHWSFERRAGELVSSLCAAAHGWDLLVVGHRALHRRLGPVVLLSPPAASAAPALAETVATALHSHVVALDAPAPDSPGAEAALLDAVSRRHAAAVVLDLGTGPLHGEEQLRHLIEAARCPVLVLGVDRPEATGAAPAGNPPNGAG